MKIIIFLFFILIGCKDNKIKLEAKCNAGDMEFCNKLATFYFKQKNREEAIRYYKKACEGENLNSCANLAILEYERRNFSKAREIFSEACNKGNMDSCNNLKKINFNPEDK